MLMGGESDGYFNPLPPQEGRPRAFGSMRIRTHHFNPLPPQEGRRRAGKGKRHERHFNPLPPQEGRQYCADFLSGFSKFQSTPSPRRETELGYSDFGEYAISIHSLPKKGDYMISLVSRNFLKFQSTPSPRRETVVTAMQTAIDSDFNPLPPQEGRPLTRRASLQMQRFQSTPSPRRETLILKIGATDVSISIHSLPKKGDVYRFFGD